MNKTLNLLLILFLGVSVTINAQQAGENTTPEKQNGDIDLVGDNLIVAALDSLSTLKYFKSSENKMSRLYDNKYNFLPNYIPSYPDSVYYYRIQRLNVESPIKLVYNQRVRMFIDLYANKKRSTTARVLGLAQMYFPMFEQQLDKYNVPLELKYLAIVESALNAKARSRVGAGGLWQFMYYTGKVYGLEVTSYVDDRNDPLKATVAACRHFNDLYNMYHDWLLVLAAYNSGAGNVNKAIRRSGGKMTFWEIMPYLPRETRDYVPAFIAVNYVMAYSNEHNIYPVIPQIQYYETDTVAVNQPLSLNILADQLKLNLSELEFLNPTFRTGFIPATPETPFYIRLPQKSIADFINNESSLYAYNKLKGYDASQFKLQDGADYDIVTKRVTHKVRKGETLASIARKYDCSTSEIKKWNKLKKSYLNKGQPLKIYVQARQPAVKAKAPKNVTVTQDIAESSDLQSQDQTNVAEEKNTVSIAVKPKIHDVQKGESLGKISAKYHVTVKDLLAWNDLKNSDLLIGQKLRVNAPERIIVAENVTKKKDKETGKPAVQNKQIFSDAKYHVVKKGEYLAKIATVYGVSSDDLVAWNSLETNNLLVGQKLRINQPDSGSNSKTVAEETPIKGKTDKYDRDLKLVFYTVKPGDTLWSICQHYDGITIDQLKEWNKLSGQAGLKVGQKIKVILPAG
ncbi:MAG: LysM peptidoglycan-binding domain-containing protein [Lentimicrobiaceae bacterium]|jgi:membrane-bound lytic murein transglycosylase D